MGIRLSGHQDPSTDGVRRLDDVTQLSFSLPI
jgi:hypothetical protein